MEERMKATFIDRCYDNTKGVTLEGVHDDLDERQVRDFARHLDNSDEEAAAIIAEVLGIETPLETPEEAPVRRGRKPKADNAEE